MPDARESWIRCFHPAPESTVRLVCFPHAGGSASFFFPVSAALSPGIEVAAVQYPGRQDRRNDTPFTAIGELADALAGVLAAMDDRPTAFFGHSMGATLAFEVARRLPERAAAGPVVLFASGRRAPSRHRHETVHLRDDDGVLAELRSLSGTDERVLGDEEIIRMIMPAVRGDYRAIESYRYAPGPGLSCPIVALTGDADPKTTLAEARAWQEHTDGDFELHTLPGGHFFLAAHQDRVLGLIGDTLRSLGVHA